jgi:hypothetical protein
MTVKQNNSTVEVLEGRQLLSGTPWGAQAKLIGQDLVAQQFPHLTGAGGSIAIIDSGVAYNHPSLGGGWGKKVVAGWDFQSNDADPMSSSYAHGTGTAAMAAADGYNFKGYHYQGIAPGAKIIALRESNSNQVAAAFKWVIANKAKYNIVAVNFTDFSGWNKAATASIRASLAKLESMGVYATAPSGNSGATYVSSYGAEAEVGSVSTRSDSISGFTNRGAGLDFLTPSDKITLPYYDVGSKKAIYTDAGYGTSFAAPQIAGAAALLRQINPGFSNAQITSILTKSAVQKYDSKTKRSYPRLNLYGAVRMAYQQAGKTIPPVVNPTPTPTPKPTPTPTPTPKPTPKPIPKPTPKPHPKPADGVTASTAITIGNNTVIQVEDFKSGGEGVAYHDTEAKNLGGNNYRPGTGVDIVGINDQSSTRAVGVTKAGEWLKYDVKVATTGTYNIEFRVASKGAGGQFHLEVDGKNVTGAMTVRNTGNWKAYASLVKTGVNLAAGNHTLRLVFDKIGTGGGTGDFNLMRFVKTGVPAKASTPATAKPAVSSRYKIVNLAAGTATTVQAENFDLGANGVAYKDMSGTNEGGQYRKTSVDIGKTLDAGGGYDLQSVKAGEWLNYSVNVTKAGTFNIDTRVATSFSGGSFHLEIDGKNVTGSLKFINTGNFEKWATVRKAGVKIAAGKHTIKLVIDSSGGHKVAANINWIKFS